VIPFFARLHGLRSKLFTLKIGPSRILATRKDFPFPKIRRASCIAIGTESAYFAI